MNEGAPDTRTLLAEQRTMLAWIRTGLALTGFGFVVARFAVFLEQLAGNGAAGEVRSSGVSAVLGVALVAAGVLVNLAAAWRHVRVVAALARGVPPAARPSTVAVATAVGLAAVGLLMAVYLSRASAAELRNEQRGREPGVTMQPSTSPNGLLSRPAARSVDETVKRLTALLAERHVTLFAVVDHGGEAAKVGLTMRPTKLLIFGSPKAGTPVMVAAPTAAIDLPLKLLVWEDAAGKVWVTYNTADYLGARHQIPPDLLANLGAAAALADQAAR
jgi:uncharacterized protein (DUF302 family)/uncharacterized membrane protein YidH (DUF202 family)